MSHTCSAPRTARQAVACAAMAWLAALPTAASAATVQVEVMDAAGKPLADAVVLGYEKIEKDRLMAAIQLSSNPPKRAGQPSRWPARRWRRKSGNSCPVCWWCP